MSTEYKTYNPGPVKDFKKEIWLASLITYTDNCEALKPYDITVKKYEQSEYPEDDDIQEQIKVLLKKFPLARQFKFRKGNPNLIRISPGDCSLHPGAHHTSNNAYLYIKGDILYFMCHCAPRKSEALGKIIFPKVEEVKQVKIEAIKEEKVEEVKEEKPCLSYEEMKLKFEKKHFKCVLSSCYYTIGENSIITHSERKLVESYRHLKFKSPAFDKDGVQIRSKAKFITSWIDDEKIKRYNTVGLYPPPLVCPDKVYNLWHGWRIENIKVEESATDEHQLIFDHLKKVFGDESYEYALDWLAFLLKKPGVRPNVAILLKSLEGLGKGFIVELLKVICGSQYVLLTKKVNRDVFGKFNHLIENKIVVCLDEMDVKTAREFEDDLKDYITNPMVSVNPKGISAYESINMVHLLSFSNKEWPWVISQTDRRYVAIDSSAVKIPEKSYFTEQLFPLLSNDSVLKKTYRILIERDISKFDPEKSRPNTDFTKDLKIIKDH